MKWAALMAGLAALSPAIETNRPEPSLSAGAVAPIGAAFHENKEGGFCACYAPGTSESYMQQFEAQLRQSGANFYSANSRWSTTATTVNTGSNGQPIVLTYSFVPDYSTGDPTTTNRLHETLDAAFGSRAAWKNLFADIFSDWSALTGVEYQEVADDGAAWPNSDGQLGVRGDVRIVGFAIDGVANVLAYNYYPNGGDLAIDIAEDWSNAGNNYRFMRNTIMHELGHGLGLGHVLPRNGTKLMEAFLNVGFEGPQDDDIRGADHYYGDVYEPNGSAAAAASLGIVLTTKNFSDMTLFGSSDVDWYSLTLGAPSAISATVTPLGGSYSVGPDPGTPASIDTRRINRLRVDILDQAGTTQVATATATSLGDAATTATVALPGGATQCKIKVSTPDGVADTQRYSLTFTMGPAAPLTVQSTPILGLQVGVSPADSDGHADGVTGFTRNFSTGAVVQLTAPDSSNLYVFDRWSVNGVDQTAGQRTLSVTITDTGITALAKYIDTAHLVVLAGQDQSMDVGQTVQFNASASGGSPPYFYVWSPPDGLSSITIPNPTASPGLTTIYTLTVTDSQDRQASDSVTVNVTPILVAEAGLDQQIRPGQAFALNGGATGGTPPYTFAWSPATGLDNPLAASANGVGTSTTTYALTVHDSMGRTTTDSVRISVITAVSASAGAAQTMPVGGSAVLAAQISGGLPPYACQWSPAGKLLTSNGSSQRVSPAQTTTYTVLVQDTLGQQATASVTVNVVSALVVSAGEDRQILPGESTALHGTASGGVPPYTFSWSPAGGLSNSSIADTTATPDESTRYTLKVQDSGGQTVEATVQVWVVSDTTGNATGNADGAAAVDGVVDSETVSAAPRACGSGIFFMLPLSAVSLLSWRLRNARRAAK